MSDEFIKRSIREKRRFDKDKEGFESTGIVGSLRSGRLDIFDEIRAAAQARIQRLEGEMDMVALMSDLHRDLQRIVKDVLDKKDETAPDVDLLETEFQYYDILIEFIEIAKKSFKNPVISEVDAEGAMFNKLKQKVNGDAELQNKIKSMAVGTTGVTSAQASQLYSRGEWISLLKLCAGDGNLTKAKKRRSQLKKKDNGETYQKAIDDLEVARQKLRAAQMNIKWIKKDTEEQLDDGAYDFSKHYKKFGSFEEIYAESTTSAIDSLIDLHRSVDSSNQNKIISPRRKKVIQKIQEINNQGLAKNSRNEMDKLVKSEKEAQMKAKREHKEKYNDVMAELRAKRSTIG